MSIKNILLTILASSIFVSLSFAQTDKEAMKAKFEELTERRINDLEEKLKIIGDKTANKDRINLAVDSAVKLFYSEDNVFQVSSKNRTDVREFKVRRYFKKLQVLPYTKVEIEWFKTEWISNFRKAPDGKYYGVARIYQVFKGYDDSMQLKYSDITSKNIEVEVEVVHMDKGNTTKEYLYVRLGDIKVVETK